MATVIVDVPAPLSITKSHAPCNLREQPRRDVLPASSVLMRIGCKGVSARRRAGVSTASLGSLPFSLEASFLVRAGRLESVGRRSFWSPTGTIRL
jgi:hypothetical protein